MLRGELLEEFSHEPVNAPSQLVQQSQLIFLNAQHQP